MARDFNPNDMYDNIPKKDDWDFHNREEEMNVAHDRGFDYKSHAKLREALEKQLFDERSDVIRLTVSTRNPDAESLQKLNQVIDTLVKKHGYTAESANQLLRYVNSLMSKTT